MLVCPPYITLLEINSQQYFNIRKIVYIMAFRVAHCDTLYVILEFCYVRGMYFMHIGRQVTCVYIFVCRWQTCLRPLIASAICVHFGELVNHCAT